MADFRDIWMHFDEWKLILIFFGAISWSTGRIYCMLSCNWNLFIEYLFLECLIHGTIDSRLDFVH